MFSSTQRFKDHSLFGVHSIASHYLFQSLLKIFTDIDHTGESMKFVDKVHKLTLSLN